MIGEHSVRCVEQIAELPGDEWDALAGPGDFFLCQRWLRVAETTSGAPMRYLISLQDGHPVAGLASVLAMPSAMWPLGRPDIVLARCVAEGQPGAADARHQLVAQNLAEALLPSLVCGGRHLGRNRILSGKATDDDTLAELITHAERLARDLGAASVSFLYVDEEDSRLRKILTASGYLSFTSAQYSKMSLPAGGFEGYLGMLSPHRRRRIRAERRRIAAAGVERRLEPMTAALVPRLAELETALFAKYGMSHWRPELSERTLSEIQARVGDKAFISSVRADGEIRGFGLIFQSGNEWYAHRAGFDYDFQGNLPLYYEVLYYMLIDAAYEKNISTIYYGIGSEQAKRSRGCAASAQYCYLLLLDEQ